VLIVSVRLFSGGHTFVGRCVVMTEQYCRYFSSGTNPSNGGSRFPVLAVKASKVCYKALHRASDYLERCKLCGMQFRLETRNANKKYLLQIHTKFVSIKLKGAAAAQPAKVRQSL
jgi:hypothetical protein